MKKRLISAHSDLKTGFFCKFFLVLGSILLLIYIVQIISHFLNVGSDAEGALLAFAILFLGIGLISYFFSCQFAKLSQIADDVEKDETLTNEEPEKE